MTRCMRACECLAQWVAFKLPWSVIYFAVVRAQAVASKLNKHTQMPDLTGFDLASAATYMSKATKRGD